MLAYLFSLKKSVVVRGKGSELIYFETAGSSMSQIFTFIESVEVAKADRLRTICSEKGSLI